MCKKCDDYMYRIFAEISVLPRSVGKNSRNLAIVMKNIANAIREKFFMNSIYIITQLPNEIDASDLTLWKD